MHEQLELMDVGGHEIASLALGADYGEVFTRRWVVELILDLSGYTPDRDLTSMVAVEPACGSGAFLGPMVERLTVSMAAHGRGLADATNSIIAFDLQASNVELARKAIVNELIDAGVDERAATGLAARWVTEHDFLLADRSSEADFILGNPPYIRLEDVPKSRSDAYRRACPTMRGRSDVYVGFIEKGLRILRPDGVLGFIVADRWMHNQYGAELRRFIAHDFSVEAVIEMHDVDAFEVEVSAYPAITILKRAPQSNAVLAATAEKFGVKQAEDLKTWITRGRSPSRRHRSYSAARIGEWFGGDQLWPAGDPECIALVKELERRFPRLEDEASGTRVGIGVATGADAVFLTDNKEAAEADRLLPLAMAEDTKTGELRWSGVHLINPWAGESLVDLAAYPRLRRHLRRHEALLRSRYVAQKRPGAWFRTIDRVDPALLDRPKLLLPDLKASIHPVLEPGGLYPHHNLYFVVSDEWDLEVLGGLLLSDVANLFVGTYCVKMRGGCYRFQAQYLRQIRVPDRSSIPASTAKHLARAFQKRDVEKATLLALGLYGIAELPPGARTRTP